MSLKIQTFYPSPMTKLQKLEERVRELKKQKRFGDRVEEIANQTEYGWYDPCGANNCDCHENAVQIQAIIQAIEELLS